MVKNKIVSSSHSKTEKMPISAKVLKWNAEHKNLSAIDALLNIKKVEGSELTDIFQEKKSDVKDLNIKERVLKGRAYELYVPSVFSSIFFVESRVFDSLRRELLIKSEQDSLVSLSQIASEKTLEGSNSTLIEGSNVEKRTVRKTLTIRVKPNNVFCTLKDEIGSRMVSGTSTKYKVKMSKKTLRYNYKVVVKSFLEETKKDLKTKFLLISISAPKRIRRELLRMLKKKLKSKDKFASANTKKDADANEKEKFGSVLMFEFHAKKCFNGCRARKKRRKKQRGLRVYK